MDPLLLGIVGILLLLLLLVIGVHIGVSLTFVGMAGLAIIIGPKAAISLATTAPFYFVTNPELIVIPTFTIMGLAAMYGGISEGAFNCLGKWLGKLPGGLGIAAVGGCTAFSTVCGSSFITALVFAKVSSPEMRRHGYEKRFAYGITSTAGIIGILIPPSAILVLYGLLTQESIGRLLIAGVFPGILLAILYCGTVLLTAWFRPGIAPPSNVHYTLKEKVTSLKDIWAVVVTAIIIIGGIYGGIFTPSEAAAWGTITILVAATLFGSMKFNQLIDSLLETVSMMGMIFFILSAARLFSRFMVVSGVAQNMIQFITDMNPSVMLLLSGLVVIYLILGCFLDSISMLSITLPIIYPVMKAMEIDPMWFAIVIIMAIEAGLITPPVGMNVFGVKSVAEADVTLGDIFWGCVPFLVMTILGIIIVMFFPGIASWLPNQMIK